MLTIMFKSISKDRIYIVLMTALMKTFFVTAAGKVSNHAPVRKRILNLKHVELAYPREYNEDEFWTLAKNRHDRLLQSFLYNIILENDQLNDEINR